MDFKVIRLPFFVKKPILALGSHTKNSLCFAKDDYALMSRIHSDLDNWQDFLDFQKDLNYLLKKRPQIFACDLHPGYRSTEVADELARNFSLKKIQHHQAHIASCMVDNRLKEKVIGVSFDGTGLGLDNHLWGAEFFVGNYYGFKRCAQLKYISLAGSEMAIKEPWRLTFSWLYDRYKDRIFKLKIDFIERLNKKKLLIIKKMLDNKFNSPLSSSMGRLFDAVGVLVLNRFFSEYEGQIPKDLEGLAKSFKEYSFNLKIYPFKIKKQDGLYIIDPTDIFLKIIKDIKDKEDKKKISFRFHLTVAKMVEKVCLKLKKDTSINKVVLSGGVFQNSVLSKLILDLLTKDNFDVFFHKEIPCFDAGISLGQVALANFS